jgi:hypothetical protein
MGCEIELSLGCVSYSDGGSGGEAAVDVVVVVVNGVD